MTGSGNTSSGFLKRYADAATAREAMRRSDMVRAGGVITPKAREGPAADSLSFARVDGHSGVALLHSCALPELLAPLRSLQAIRPEGLPRFDPFLRVLPRLAGAPATALPTKLVAPLACGLPSSGGTVHGDFHFGQLICDAQRKIWIVDLDDMATGPPEADLGNLIAHLATRKETALATLARSLAHWRGKIITAWEQPCNMMFLDRFLMIASLRRALKLQEQGRAELMPELLPLLSAA